MKKSTLLSIVCVCAVAINFYAASTRADIVTLTAEGTVQFVGSGISSDFSLGDRAIYELIYDTNAFNSSFEDPIAYYSAMSYSVTVGSYSATSSTGFIDVFDNFSSIDLFRVNTLVSDGLTGDAIGGHALDRIFFQLKDKEELWLDSVDLPTSFLSANRYENKVFRVDFADQNILTGDLDTFTVEIEISQIPVPGAVWLFGSGLLGLIGIARRKTS